VSRATSGTRSASRCSVYPTCARTSIGFGVVKKIVWKYGWVCDWVILLLWIFHLLSFYVYIFSMLYQAVGLWSMLLVFFNCFDVKLESGWIDFGRVACMLSARKEQLQLRLSRRNTSWHYYGALDARVMAEKSPAISWLYRAIIIWV
jgi:hypothetical protein